MAAVDPATVKAPMLFVVMEIVPEVPAWAIPKLAAPEVPDVTVILPVPVGLPIVSLEIVIPPEVEYIPQKIPGAVAVEREEQVHAMFAMVFPETVFAAPLVKPSILMPINVAPTVPFWVQLVPPRVNIPPERDPPPM
jgi:hypothetical protein